MNDSEGEGAVLSKEQLLRSLYRPGEIRILGLTARAGGGKSSTARELKELADHIGIPCVIVELDWFLKLSSRDRQAWLDDGERLGSDEYARRSNEIAWWDLDEFRKRILALKRGEPLQLRGVYHRANRGEKTLNVDINVESAGLLVLLDGTVILESVEDLLDACVYLHVSDRERLRRLIERDPHRGEKEARKRFAITQKFEREFFRRVWRHIDLFVWAEKEPLQVLPHLSPDEVLREDGSVSEHPFF